MFNQCRLPLAATMLLVSLCAVAAPASATKVDTQGDQFKAVTPSPGVSFVFNNGAGPTITCTLSEFTSAVPAAGGNKRNVYDGNAAAVEPGGSVVTSLTPVIENPKFTGCSSPAATKVTISTIPNWYFDWYATLSGTTEVYIGALTIPDEGIRMAITAGGVNGEVNIGPANSRKPQSLLGDWKNGANSENNPSTWTPKNQLECSSTLAAFATPIVFKATYQFKDTTEAKRPVKVTY
jgi:hypothetical protein